MSQALLLRVIALEAALAALDARVSVFDDPSRRPAPETPVAYRIEHAGFGKWRVVNGDGMLLTGNLRKDEAERLAAEFTANAVQLAARSVA